MIVHKFGGATTRSARGLETLAELVCAAHLQETKRLSRRSNASESPGLIVVISAIGHTTRYLQRAAEHSSIGNLASAEEYLERVTIQHAQLLSSLKFPEAIHAEITTKFRKVYQDVRALIEGIHITRELSLRARDQVIGNGERFALALIGALLRRRGIAIAEVNAREVMITNEEFGRAKPVMSETTECLSQQVLPRLLEGELVLIEGFVGGTRDGVATTMGSESSDLTATVIAAALGAKEIVIWKNVAGIFDADPELIPEARLIRRLSLAESEEIGRRGARVLFQTAAEPLANLEREPILRIASPSIAIRSKTGNFKSTTISREAMPHTPHPKPLALTLDPHLSALRLRPRANEHAIEGESPRRNRRLREKFSQLRARTLYTQTTPEDVFAVLRREWRSDLVESLSSAFEISEESPVASLALIVRSSEADVRQSFAELRSEMIRSLRQFAPIACFTSGKSIIALLDDTSGEAALKKLYRDLMSR